MDSCAWLDNLAARGTGRGEEGKNVASRSAGDQKEKSSPGPAPAGVMVVEDTDALDCGVCFLPLKPPIYQCDVGHVVCLPCCDKLKATGKCYVCGAANGAYRRCHAMERLVDSIRGPCQNAVHGCTARLTYHNQPEHFKECRHAPFCCPGQDCGFVGSMEVLLYHFTLTHGWPCITKIRFGEKCSVRLYDGFNFLLTDHIADCQGGRQYLFLMNVARMPLGRAISVLSISQKPLKRLKCVLSYSQRHYDRHERHKSLGSHLLQSDTIVECTDLSNGVPILNDCFQFIVPDYFLGDGDKGNAITVKGMKKHNTFISAKLGYCGECVCVAFNS